MGVALLSVILATVTVGYLLFPQPETIRIVIRGVTLIVEVARTTADQQKGLSGRDSMPVDRGMLFIFEHEAVWSFWMKDMRFALDIIWFNRDRVAVFILQGLPPCNPQDCPVYTPTSTSLYVLEVNAGFVRTHELSLGDQFFFVS